MKRVLTLAMALFVGLVPAFAQDATVPFVVLFAPAEDASELLLAGRTGLTTLDTDLSDGRAEIDLPAGPASAQPRAIILEWRDGSRTEFPVYIFPEFAQYGVQVQFLHGKSLPRTQAEADLLCRDSKPSDTGFAFEMVFGCRLWLEQLEARNRKWSREYLWALNGWIIGNRYLFRQTVSAADDQFSPFGYQEQLIARLQEVVERAETQGWDRALMRPLNLTEIADILLEHDQAVLRYVGRTGPLTDAGEYRQALELNRTAYDVYLKVVQKEGQPSVFGIDRQVLTSQMKTLQELIRGTKP